MRKTIIFVAAALAVQLAGAQGTVEGKLVNVKKLTNTAQRYENPRWSPDGTRISYTDEGYDGLYVINPNGTQAKKLSADAGVGYMHQWSADSREILVRDTRWMQSADGIERFHAAWSLSIDGKKVRLTEDATYLQPATWLYSAAGEKTIHVRGAAKVNATLPRLQSSSALKLANSASSVGFICDCEQLIMVNGQGHERVLNVGPSFCPALSPNGKMVAFNENDDIYLINVDGSGKRLLARGFNATWVNNSQIVYELTADNGHEYTAGELYIINADGSEKKALTATDNRIEMNPCVSPDGKKLVFTNNIDGQLYTADIK